MSQIRPRTEYLIPSDDICACLLTLYFGEQTQSHWQSLIRFKTIYW